MRRASIWLVLGAVVCSLVVVVSLRGGSWATEERLAALPEAQIGPVTRAPAQGPAASSAGPSPADDAAAEPAPCYVGVLVARGATEVVAQTAGTLEELPVAVGDVVDRGQEIAVVAAPASEHRLVEQSARLEAARSALESARVEEARARREAERRQGAPQLFSTAQIEEAEFQLELAELGSEGQQARLAEARAAWSRIDGEERQRRLYAPFAGRVSARYAVTGAAVTAGQPLLELVSTAPPIVRFAVPSGDTGRFAVDSRVRFEVVSSGVVASAIVETVAPVLDEASQLVFVEAGTAAELGRETPFGAVLRVSPEGEDGPGLDCRARPVILSPDGPFGGPPRWRASGPSMATAAGSGPRREPGR